MWLRLFLYLERLRPGCPDLSAPEMCPSLDPMWSFTCDRREGGLGVLKAVRGGTHLPESSCDSPSPSSLDLGGSQSGRNLRGMQEAPGSTPSPEGRALNGDRTRAQD